MITTTLNQGQQEAADAFFTFLFSADREMIVSGPGGVGKTHLMSHMIDKVMPQYHQTCDLMNIKPEFDEVVMTATTNKAAEVLAVATNRPTSTIHSFMNLKVEDNYNDGTQKIAPTRNYHVKQRKIIFIDECSMIDSQLYKYLMEGTHLCKLVYVGDHCQLAPVMEQLSPVFKNEKPFYVLTEQMRNNNQPALMEVCEQLRETVKTGEFKPIRIVPGVIDLLDDAQMQQELENHFMVQSYDTRILAYTNNRVMLYNDFIRQMRGLPAEFTVGEYLINNCAYQARSRMLTVEEEFIVDWVSPNITNVTIDDGAVLQVRYMNLTTRIGELFENIPVPVDREHHKALIKYFQKKGRETKYWAPYFELKNNYPDLRQRDAATFHKSQGSTYDSVFIDLNDLSSCRNADQAARMFYVAMSRARNRVYLYGNLAPKFGGLIQ